MRISWRVVRTGMLLLWLSVSIKQRINPNTEFLSAEVDQTDWNPVVTSTHLSKYKIVALAVMWWLISWVIRNFSSVQFWHWALDLSHAGLAAGRRNFHKINALVTCIKPKLYTKVAHYQCEWAHSTLWVKHIFVNDKAKHSLSRTPLTPLWQCMHALWWGSLSAHL